MTQGKLSLKAVMYRSHWPSSHKPPLTMALSGCKCEYNHTDVKKLRPFFKLNAPMYTLPLPQPSLPRSHCLLQ